MLMQASCGAPLHWFAAFGTDPVAFLAGAVGFSPPLTTFVAGGGFATTTPFVAGAGFSMTAGAVTAATGASAGGSDAQALRSNAPAIISLHRKFMVRISRRQCWPECQSPRAPPAAIMTPPGGSATPVARFFFGRGDYVTRRAVASARLAPRLRK